jgi:hypothetical protein
MRARRNASVTVTEPMVAWAVRSGHLNERLTSWSTESLHTGRGLPGPCHEMSRTRLLLLLLAGLVLGFVAPVLGLPVTTTRTGGVEDPPGWDRIGRAVETTVELVAAGPGRVAVANPSLTAPEVFDAAKHVKSMQGFSSDPESGSFVSDGGGNLIIEGVFGDLNLKIESQTGSGEIRITRTTPLGAQVLTHSAQPGWVPVHVPSPSSTLVRQRLALLRPFTVPDGAIVSIGPHRVPDEAGHVSMTALAKTGVATVVHGWLLIGIAVLILVFCWAVGRVLMRQVDPPVAAAMVFGLCLLACLTNSLAYWLPIRWVAPLVLVAAGSVGLLAIGKTAARLRASFGRDLATVCGRLGLVLLPTLLVFWPVFTWGPWFAGGYKTDLYEYASLSSLAADHSLLSLRSLDHAQASGNITSGAGIVWRSIDSVTTSLVSQLFGLSTLGGFVVLGILLFLVFGVTVLAFARHGERPSLFLALVALLNPLLIALFLENYYSQYYFVALIPSFVLLVSWICTSPRILSSHSWAVASVAAAMIAVYPYFFALVAAAFVVILATATATRAAMRRLAVPVMVRTALLTNLALLPVLNYGKTQPLTTGLDRIARDLLLGPWGSTEVTEMLLGLRSYHWRLPLKTVDGLDASLMALLEVAGHSVAPSTIWATVIVGSIVVVAVIVGVRSGARQVETRLSVGVVVAFVAFGLIYGAIDHPYVMLKSLWVAAALVPIVVAGIQVPRRAVVPALIAGAALAALWATTLMADRIAWLLPLGGSLDRSLHLSVVPDLHRLSQELDGDRSDPAVMARGKQPLAGSDRDRVLAAFTVVLFRDADVACLTCRGTRIPVTLSCSTSTVASAATIGVDARKQVCGLPRRLEGAFQDVYSARDRDEFRSLRPPAGQAGKPPYPG